ncbi:PTS sugar transporter subunit IIA [Enterococcus faecalis]
MRDNFIQLFPKLKVTSRSEVYAFISNWLYPSQNEKALLIEKALYKREAAGDIQIDAGVVLPHVESQLVENSLVAVIRPLVPIKHWHATIENVDLIIVVLLAPNQSGEAKQRLVDFMRQLADGEYLNKLRTMTISD